MTTMNDTVLHPSVGIIASIIKRKILPPGHIVTTYRVILYRLQ